MRYVKIPNTGWCIAKSGRWYDDCFANKKSALKAAQHMANTTRQSVDLVRVTNRGQDRWVAETVYPQSVDNPLRPYYTVRIPYTETARTKWHPTERSGPFSTLSRGVFSTKEEAHAWASKHLGNTRHSVLRVTAHDVAEVRDNPSWAKVFG